MVTVEDLERQPMITYIERLERIRALRELLKNPKLSEDEARAYNEQIKELKKYDSVD